MKFCTNCGAQLEEGSKFCTECGQRIRLPEQPVAVAEVPATATPEATVHVYGQPVSHNFSAPVFTESEQSVVCTYGAPVSHGFTPAVQSRTDLTGTYEGYSERNPAPVPVQPQSVPVSQPAQIRSEPAGKKNGGKKPPRSLIIGIAAMAVVILLVMLLGGGDGNDPNLGRYNGISCICEGVEIGAEGEWIELMSDGKAKIMLMGEEFSGKWELNGHKLTVTQAGDAYTGTLEEGLLTLDFGGMIYTYVNENGQAPALDTHETEATAPKSQNEPEDSTTDPIRSFWEGDWYGWWSVWSADGVYESMEDEGWDAYAHIEVNDDNTGTVTLWDTDGSRDDPLAVVEVSFRSGVTEYGCMVSESGMFTDCAVGHAD